MPFSKFGPADWIQLGLLIVAVGTLALNFLMIRQASRSTRSVQRAYVSVEGIDLNGPIEPNKTVVVTFALKNTGQTPALHLTPKTTLILDSEIPSFMMKRGVRLPDAPFQSITDVGAGQHRTLVVDLINVVRRDAANKAVGEVTTTQSLTRPQIRDLSTGTLTLYGFVQVRYRDVFAGFWNRDNITEMLMPLDYQSMKFASSEKPSRLT